MFPWSVNNQMRQLLDNGRQGHVSEELRLLLSRPRQTAGLQNSPLPEAIGKFSNHWYTSTSSIWSEMNANCMAIYSHRDPVYNQTFELV